MTNPSRSGVTSGNLIAVEADYEFPQIGERYALVTMCTGGGQGVAVVFEQMEYFVPAVMALRERGTSPTAQVQLTTRA